MVIIAQQILGNVLIIRAYMGINYQTPQQGLPTSFRPPHIQRKVGGKLILLGWHL
jgi:hypothetical protein